MERLLILFSGIHPLVSFCIFTVIAVMLSVLVRWLWNHVLLRLAHFTATSLDRRLFSATAGPAQFLFIAAGITMAWRLTADGISERLNGIENIDSAIIVTLVGHGVFLITAFAGIAMVWKALFAVLDWYQEDIASKTATTLDDKIIPTIRKILKTLIIVFAVMFISDHFDLPLSKLWAAAGIGSLAIALAAKDTFANIISGIIILIDRPFLIGDRIELADGTYGDVLDIGLRSTKILSFDNTIYILPNAEISNQRITNHAYPDFRIKVRHAIGVAYGTDIGKAKGIIGEVLAEHPKVLNEPAWGIYFTEFADSSLNLLVIYWVADYKDKFAVRDEINTVINTRFEDAGVVIPFPQRDVHLFSESDAPAL